MVRAPNTKHPRVNGRPPALGVGHAPPPATTLYHCLGYTRVREHASQPNPRPTLPSPAQNHLHHPPALTTANSTRSTRPTEANGTPATRGLPPPTSAKHSPASTAEPSAVSSSHPVIAESAAVRELSSTGNRPRNPHIGNPNSSAATGKTARHCPGFIRCRLSTTTRCTNHGCQIRPLMPSQDGGSGPSQAPCQPS